MRKLFSFAVAALAALVGFGEMVSPALFSKKCEFTVSGYAGSSTLSDFPVLVRLSAGSPSGFSYADCQTDGSDLRFADADGNLLSHEIDTWNTAGESLIWVKVPSLVGKTTAVTCYYGANPVSLPTVDLHDTWTKYVTVIHGGTTIADSSVKKLALTANAVTGTAAGENGGFVGGGMNKASRNTKGVNVPSPYKNNLLTNVRQYSISFWAKSPTKSDDGTHVTVCGVSAWSHGGMLGLFERGHGWSVAVSGAHHYVDGKGKLPANTWTHTSFSYDTELGHYTSYSNGELIKAWTDSNKYTDSGTSYWTFGGYADTANGDNFYGDLDECRIYDGIASEDWVKAEYDSMQNTSFVVGGTVQTVEIPLDPTISCVASEVTMFKLGITVTVIGFGDGASGCDLHAVLASDAGYETVLGSFDKTSSEVAAGTGYAIGAENLNFGTTYYLKVEAMNDKGEKTTVEKTFDTLPAPACETTFALEKGGSTLGSFFWSLSDFGDMSSYAYVAVEWATDETFTDPSSQAVVMQLDSPTNETRVVVRGLTASTQYYVRLKTVNECGTVGYSRPIKVVTTAAEQNRIWAGTGTDMNDPMSYVEQVLPGENDTIYFNKPATADAQPYLSESMTVRGVFFGRYDKERTSAEEDPTGYVITGADGAKLTLTGSGGTDYAVNSATTAGEAEINVQIVLSGSNPHLAANGMRINLSGAISTTGEYTQDVQTLTGGADEAHIGYLVFSAANPDFKPSKIHWCTGRLVYAHPQALMSLKKISSGNWGGYLPYVYNTSGEPLVMDLLEKIEAESYGLNQITFEGAPFVMTNCEFSVSQRDNKARVFNAAVSFKSVGAWDYNNNCFSKYGTNMLEVVGDYHESANITGHVQVIQGMFYPHRLLETVARADRRFRLNGDGVNPSNGGIYPTLGVDKDVRIPVSDLGGISFGKDNEMKGGGFSGMGGEVKVTLTDKSDSQLTLVNGVKTPEGSGYIMPYPLAFGNISATGTAVLMNEVSRDADSDFELYGFQGKAYVAGRFAATVASTKNRMLNKRGNGVVAFESACNFGNSYVWEGGLLFNGDCTGTPSWTAKGGAMIGGTGSCKSITIDGNATLRPGEFGGTLTVKEGSVSLETGAKVVIDIAADKHSCLAVEAEGSYYYKTPGANGATMEINLVDGAPASGKVKIMDWSKAKADSLTNLFDPSSYTLTYDEAKISEATLTRDDTEKALYLEYKAKEPGPAEDVGFMIYVL